MKKVFGIVLSLIIASLASAGGGPFPGNRDKDAWSKFVDIISATSFVGTCQLSLERFSGDNPTDLVVVDSSYRRFQIPLASPEVSHGRTTLQSFSGFRKVEYRVSGVTGWDILTLKLNDYGVSKVTWHSELSAEYMFECEETVTLPNLLNDTENKGIFLSYDFDLGKNGWQHGFANYWENEEVRFQIDGQIFPLPIPLTGNGYKVQGFNHTDELIMFLHKIVGIREGLKPNHCYDIDFRVSMATNAKDEPGPGGSPASLSLQVGGYPYGNTDVYPRRQLMKYDAKDPRYWRLMVGKEDIRDMALNIGKTGSGRIDNEYVIIERRGKYKNAMSSNTGDLFIYVGTSSGHESFDIRYYTNIELQLSPCDVP